MLNELKKFNQSDVKTPGAVPPEYRAEYVKNFLTVTHDTGRLMLFAGDQKLEHLNKDFYGDGIAEDDGDPEHMFKIASQATLGAFATQLGLISRYGQDYKDIPYIVKLNSKTNIVKTDQKDPLSVAMTNISDVIAFKKSSGLNIVGIGYTVYIGSEFESVMLTEASQAIFHAHQNGLLSVIWAYPRGKAIKDEKDPNLIAGAAGAVGCLGADFVKVNAPKAEGKNAAELLQQATKAAGRTGVVCAGGGSDAAETFLKKLYDQIHIGGTRGNATGRNIHQKPLAEAVRMCNAISAITFEDKTAEQAINLYNG